MMTREVDNMPAFLQKLIADFRRDNPYSQWLDIPLSHCMDILQMLFEALDAGVIQTPDKASFAHGAGMFFSNYIAHLIDSYTSTMERIGPEGRGRVVSLFEAALHEKLTIARGGQRHEPQ